MIRVKPLVWQEEDGGMLFLAFAAYGMFEVWQDDENMKWAVEWPNCEMSEQFDTVEEAKAAAQCYHEREILGLVEEVDGN